MATTTRIRLPKLYRAERGTPGSMHHASSLYLTRAEAENRADGMADYWAAHPATTNVPLSTVEELPLTSAEERTIRACLRSERGRVVLGKEVRVESRDLNRLINLWLVKTEEVVVEVPVGLYRSKEVSTELAYLTPKGIAWAKGASL